MLKSTFKLLLAVAVSYVVTTNAQAIADWIVDISGQVAANPRDTVIAASTLLMLVALVDFMVNTARTLTRGRSVHVSAGATIALSRDTDESKHRRARHEAAHAVVMLALGYQDVTAHIKISDKIGGSATGSTKLTTLIDGGQARADISYGQIITALAGHQVDTETGNHDFGSDSDFASVINHVTAVLSVGLVPRGHDGPLSSDSLIASAREHVGHILDENKDSLDLITEFLVKHRVMSPADFERFPVTPATSLAIA